jgi:hypothetical protein
MGTAGDGAGRGADGWALGAGAGLSASPVIAADHPRAVLPTD